MKQGRVFMVGQTENTLIPMDESAYAREKLLQEWIAAYPDLLPGDQISPEAPRRWLLVAREMGVTDPESMAVRWSLDHLFLDQDGVLTLVECKRSSDSRIRREVIAQMLEYAANGLTQWSVDLLRRAAAQTAQSRGRSLDAELQALLGEQPDYDIERYWQQVADNLRLSKARLLFVADSIPHELRQLVEFLNKQMPGMEVLAVEIKQFLSANGQRVMVPRLIGMTEAAREQKTVTPTTRTTRMAFLESCPPEAVPIFEQMLAFADEHEYLLYFGKAGFSIRPLIGGTLTSVLYGWPPAAPPTRIEFYTGYLRLVPEALAALRMRLDALGIFTLGGEHTYRAAITPASAGAIQAALPQIFALVEELVGGEV
ncbi:hypothetical protein K2Z83_23840 [Oscillochloris sp. ZM17-4]|uniref:hypothetical protein n=1 Tax=Oscillochloris sp. ZM17-4 TaxID=2866714 RepID=UPI001C736F16|nr:hypothetical protein [Oscillochloris sp. ZM17-4]MBX0330693.1 hypothetical protein [Oscillochloris sp. ZM17-4]